jgi:hypothetical protein
MTVSVGQRTRIESRNHGQILSIVKIGLEKLPRPRKEEN